MTKNTPNFAKLFLLPAVAVTVVSVTFFILEGKVLAQTGSCGDGIIQAPNASNEWERCDSEGVDTATCTSTCESKLMGWGWSSHAGWISLNSENCNPQFLNPAIPCSTSLEHYVKVANDQAGTVTGNAWSDHVGWICFGSTCCDLVGDPDCQTTEVSVATPSTSGEAYDPIQVEIDDEDVGPEKDDGTQIDGSATWSGTATSANIGQGQTQTVNAGLRFQNVNIPTDAEIETAILTVSTIYNSDFPFNNQHPPTFNIYADRVANATAWGDGNGPNDIIKTENFTFWDTDRDSGAGVDAGGTYEIDVTSVVQEVTDLAGWQSGNSIRFGIITNSGLDPDSTITLIFEEHSLLPSATLDIAFVPPETTYNYSTQDPDITLDFTGDVENPPLVGWAQIIAAGGEGWLSFNCENSETCVASDYKTLFSQGNFLGQGEFGNTSARTLSGWAWNGSEQQNGIGWVQFNPPIAQILPWLQTRFGDIYSRGGISGNPAPSSAFNATYRILAGGSVSQFTSFSQTGGQAWVSPDFGPIDFPTPDTGYSNVLGKLDANRLIDQRNTDLDLDPGAANLPQLLNGEVYYYDASVNSGEPLTIDSAGLSFGNGTDFQNGSGTIIIDGDLVINGNTRYDDSSPAQRFRNLASVAWIVRGDVIIDGSVTELAGNFIVLGNGAACPAAGCGRISSCTTNCGNRLVVSGLMMAREFSLGRTFVDDSSSTVQQGSEIILYDGRLLANTPPGLGDFSKALPVWRAGTFER